MNKSFGFLKTTAIGGLIFLLPLIVIGALVGQVVPIVITIAKVLGDWLPVKSAGGISLLVLLAIAVLLFLCFLSGLAARRSIGRKFSEVIEKNLLLLFPRYAIFKDQMAGSIGGDHTKPRMKPVLVRFDDASRIAFETDRTDAGLVTIYLPGAPDPWSGYVAYMTADRVEPLEIEFSDAVATLEQMGRESAKVLDGPTSKTQRNSAGSAADTAVDGESKSRH
jgi:uncharacterized membrane protein